MNANESYRRKYRIKFAESNETSTESLEADAKVLNTWAWETAVEANGRYVLRQAEWKEADERSRGRPVGGCGGQMKDAC